MFDPQHILVGTTVTYTCPRTGRRERGVVTSADAASRRALVCFGADTYSQITRLSDLETAGGSRPRADMFS